MRFLSITYFTTLRIILQSRFTYSVLTAELFSFLNLLMGLVLLPFSKLYAASSLMKAHRNTRRSNRQKTIEWLLNRFQLLNDDTVAQLVPTKFRHDRIYHGRFFVLKMPTNTERGVLLVKYSELFAKLLVGFHVDRILEKYNIVLEPSYSSYCTPEILAYRQFSHHTILIQSPEVMDFGFVERLNSNLRPIDLGSCNWVDDRTFFDLALEKEYDCIMVALWGQIKRHYVLFKALKQINDPSYKVCLVGGPWGLTRSHIEQMADFYGVRANCDFYERLKPPQVNEMLNKSKVNVLLTLKEGANKSIFEGFFANVPGIVLKNNYGVNKKLINQHTGKLIDEVELAETLLWFRDHYRNFHARKWAMDHISPNKSTMQLQSALQRIAHEMGEPWTTDIAVKVNRPECEYYDSSVQISPFDLMAYKKSVT